MTAVVERAERAGKKVTPLIVPTNNPLHAVLRTAKDLGAQELIMGASNKFTAEEQLDQLAFYWISLHEGQPRPLTIRVLGRNRDLYFDLEGGSRIPKISERHARTVSELRAAGIGVDRVLLTHDGTPPASDLFQSVLTMLDPEVVLDLALIGPTEGPSAEASSSNHDLVRHDQERAEKLGREVRTHALADEPGAKLVQLAREGGYDLIIVAPSPDAPRDRGFACPLWTDFVVTHAHCPVFLVAPPGIPQDIEE
jgi:nucleotide-binding universal stress UspA family protein